MRREDRFVLSHRPYAVALATFRMEMSTGWNGEYSHGTIDAVWFRRKSGVTAACVGTLSNMQYPPALDVAAFLAGFDDGRYGGDCLGRWDGTRYWGAGQDPDVNAAYLELLRGMLAAFPDVPACHDGWWVF